MGNLTWRLKQLSRNIVPVALVCAVLYGAYCSYRHHWFRHGVSVAAVLRHVPVIGGAFRPHHSAWIAYSRHHRGRHHRGHHRRHHHRRHHHHR